MIKKQDGTGPYQDGRGLEELQQKQIEKVDPIKEFKLLTDEQTFKTSNDLYITPKVNEKFATGIQWDGVNSRNLKKTTYNMIGQIQSIKNPSILAHQLSISRDSDAIDEDDENVQAAIKAFNLADTKNWERLKMDNMNKKILFDGSIQNLGISYWFWNNEIESGNKFKTMGDIDAKIIDMPDFYVANPTQVDVQKQLWVKLTVSMTLEEAKEFAKNKGVDAEQLEMIAADENDIYKPYTKNGENQQSKEVTIVYNFKKINKKVHSSITTKDIVIEDWKDLDLNLYPLAVFTYKTRKKFAYGEAEMTRYIENQKVANTQAAAQHLNAIMMAVPQTLINSSVLKSYTGAIGAIQKVSVSTNTPLSNLFYQAQPKAMGADVDKSITNGLDRTRMMAGVGDNLMGTARPENAAALMTQIKQAGVPFIPYQDRIYDYIEQVASIWLEFYKTKYNMTRKLKNKTTEEVVEFVGTDYANVYLNTKTNVGASYQWSEITELQQLNDLWDRQIITDPLDYITRLPSNAIKNQQDLIDKLKDNSLIELLKQSVISQLPPEMQEEFNQMDDKTLAEALKQLSGGQNEVPRVQ